MVLGKLPVPGRPTIWITVGQGPTALAVGAGGGRLDIFTLFYPFFPLSPSLWETARYRLKYCLKGPLNPKPTNQPTLFYIFSSLLLYPIPCKVVATPKMTLQQSLPLAALVELAKSIPVHFLILSSHFFFCLPFFFFLSLCRVKSSLLNLN